MSAERSRKRALIWLLTLGWLALSDHPAEAHRPYFTRFEAVVLPDGRTGEMRVIAGDGIFFADPTRLLVIDDRGRLLGRSAAHQFVDLICEAARRCYGYNLLTSDIIEPDPTTFGRDGSEVPPMDWEERDGLWSLENGSDTWGVKVRPATISEDLFANWYLLKRSPGTGAFCFILGLIAGLPFLGLHRLRGPGLGRAVLWCLGFVLRIVGSLALCIVGLAWTLMSYPLSDIFYGIVVVGIATSFIIDTIARRLQSRREAGSVAVV